MLKGDDKPAREAEDRAMLYSNCDNYKEPRLP